jgi:hypothetical protein
MNLQNELDQTLASYIQESVLVHLLASAACRIRRIDAIEAAALDLLFDPACASLSIYHKIAAAMGDIRQASLSQRISGTYLDKKVCAKRTPRSCPAQVPARRLPVSAQASDSIIGLRKTEATEKQIAARANAPNGGPKSQEARTAAK